MSAAYIGIDPGKSGGIAVLNNSLACAWKIPKTERDCQELFEELAATDGCFAYIEKVHAMPGQGVTSMFNFGRNYGMLRAMLICNKIPFESVKPQAWQAPFGLKNSKWTKTEKKNQHKARAQELFPKITMTHALADALLIAEFARRTKI